METNSHLRVIRTKLVRGLDGTGYLQVKTYADGTVDLSPMRDRDSRWFTSLSRAGVARLVMLLTEGASDGE